MKYQSGDFGYWWTEIMGRTDIENDIYYGDIVCDGNEIINNSTYGLTSLKGCPEKVQKKSLGILLFQSPLFDIVNVWS